MRKIDEILSELQTLGTNYLCRKKVYRRLMGDRTAFDSYKGDIPPEDIIEFYRCDNCQGIFYEIITCDCSMEPTTFTKYVGIPG